MSEFGLYGLFPFDFGGVESVVQIEHQALLDSLAPGWDTGEDTELYAETYAEAVAISAIWAVNRRLESWFIPSAMMESLRVWEESTGLRPNPSQEDISRRNAVAGRLRGLISNSIGDIEEAARSVLGQRFDGLIVVDPANDIVFWPGQNPGPPGFEWSSNRARFGIRIERTGLSDTAYADVRSQLFAVLSGMAPAWMNFQIGVGDGFTINQGVVGQTFI